ncbi:hypothetical protein R5R35_009138 [Gryllus longicercus]
MLKHVNISQFQKLSSNKSSIISDYEKSQNPSHIEMNKKLNGDENLKLQYHSIQQEKFNDRQKSIAEHKALFEEMSFKENLQNSVEKLQSKMDKQLVLRDHNYTDRSSKNEITNNAHKYQDDAKEVKEELQHILTLKFLTYEDAKKLVEFLFHHKIPLKIKVFIILRLEDECASNRDIVRKAFDKSMIQLFESLLEKYCCTVSVFGRKNVQIEDKARPPRELCLLNPLTKLFASIACYPHSRFLQVHLVSLLINAVTFIASNIDNIQRKIILLCQGKTLLCDTFEMDSNAASQLLSNLISLRLDDWVHGAHEVILYGNVGKEANKNMNEEIIKVQPNMDCTKLDSIQNNFPENSIGNAKKYITVIRTKSPRYILMYLGEDWEEHLKEISDHIQKITETKPESYFRNGNVVGFHHDDVEFENTFLKAVPFLRGLIVSQQKGNVLLWAMDIGTWVYARREKLICLKHTPLNSLEPLVSIGQLKGSVCDVDEDFLVHALSILRHAAMKNNDIGKKVFMPDAGENLLLLAEHHNSAIRRYIFDILLILTKYKEGCVFLHKKGFDVFLTGKLEFWAHITRSGLRQFPRIKTEIFIMVKIFSAIFSVYPDNKWCGLTQAKRALKILMIGQDQHTEVFENVLHQIEETEEHDERDTKSNLDENTAITNGDNYQKRTAVLPQRHGSQCCESDSSPENEINFREKAKEESAFVYQSVINVKSDLYTHICEGTDSTDIRPLEMAEVICGLLNNNVEGSIFIGLSPDSVVVGIIMKDSDLKILVKDIEIIMTKFIRPALSKSNYDIKFLPVLENRNGLLQIKSNVYVIQLKLYPHKRVVYSLHDGTKYYTRKGVKTVEHSTEKRRKEYPSKEIDEKTEETCKTNLSVTTANDSLEAQKLSDEDTQHSEGGNLRSIDSSQNDSFIEDRDNFSVSPQSSEIQTSSNLISPVFHFIKKLIPNTANE